MKLTKLFKKSESKTTANRASNIETLDKMQLEKVIGGGDDTVAEEEARKAAAGVMGQKAKAWMVSN
jgi:hypothetical protein